jgi:methionyl-tRNA formyltransferase
MENRPRIIFMGTPEFAVASLGSLLMNCLNVVAVVTAPDKPAGRGRSLKCSAVAKYGADNFLNVLKPHNLKDPQFISTLKALEPDIIVVVAFRMLPREVWEIPPIGTFNLHASLLPQYRGAAPINHAIINGESRSGVTTFLIDEKIDTGNILLRKEVPVSNEESAGQLHDRLMREGAKLVVKTTELLFLGAIKAVDQSSFIKQGEILRLAPKIFTDDCFISWDRGTKDIYNMIRGLSPYPGARTILAGEKRNITIKILKSRPCQGEGLKRPGDLSVKNGKSLCIATADGYLEILKLQPEGRQKMSGDEFLRGFKIDGFTAT